MDRPKMIMECTDVGNQKFFTHMSLYSFYGNVSGESVQVFTKTPPGISKFSRAYIPSYVLIVLT